MCSRALFGRKLNAVDPALLVASCTQTPTRPAEQADVDKEVIKQQTRNGREAELQKLVDAWQERGLDRDLAQRVAVTLTEKDVVRAHARVRRLLGCLQAHPQAFSFGGACWPFLPFHDLFTGCRSLVLTLTRWSHPSK